MEDAYLNYEKAVFRARVNAEVVGREFTWDNTATKYLDAIGRENLELPDVEPVDWVEPVARRYLVRVNSPRFFEVGGLQYILEPGRDYWEPADVKRVLYDGGHLDLSCLPQNLLVNEGGDKDPQLTELESGLTPKQLEGLGEYSGAHSRCPTCTQLLNSNLPTMEDMEALPVPKET
jgi:hypothetical protein